MKKMLLTLVLVLCLSLTAGALCEERVHLTVGIAEMPQVIDFETNRMTQLLEEEGNLDLDFVTYVGSEMIEKLNVEILAGGENLPDVIMFGSGHRPTNSAVYNWALNDAIIPLTQYVYDPEASKNLNASLETANLDVDLLKMITMPDGEIYYLPGYYSAMQNEYRTKNWIYQPWLDTLGLEAPTDAESLYTVLKAFKEQDPNGNGKADEIPLMSFAGTGSDLVMRSLLSMFCDVGNAEFYAVKDGQVYASFITEEFREGLRYVKKLVDEGLLSPLTFTQDEAQWKALVSQEPTIIGMGIHPSMATRLPATDERRDDYVGIPPFAQADGTVITPITPTNAYPAFVVTRNCKNPEAAYRLGDLMCSERFTVMNRWGEEGIDWIRPGDDAVCLYADMGFKPYLQETGTISWGSPQNQNWYNNGAALRGFSVANGLCWNGNPLDSEYLISKIMPAYYGHGPAEYLTTLIYTEEENDLIAEPDATIDSYRSQAMAQFVTGSLDLDKDWDTYLRELNNDGLEDVLTVMQAAYDRNK